MIVKRSASLCLEFDTLQIPGAPAYHTTLTELLSGYSFNGVIA